MYAVLGLVGRMRAAGSSLLKLLQPWVAHLREGLQSCPRWLCQTGNSPALAGSMVLAAAGARFPLKPEDHALGPCPTLQMELYIPRALHPPCPDFWWLQMLRVAEGINDLLLDQSLAVQSFCL